VKELNFIEATVFAVESEPANVLLLDSSINVVDPATAGALLVRYGDLGRHR
jgi:hypothetical protein